MPGLRMGGAMPPMPDAFTACTVTNKLDGFCALVSAFSPVLYIVAQKFQSISKQCHIDIIVITSVFECHNGCVN